MKRLLVVSLIILVAALGCTARGIVVNSTADSGTGTLRWALEIARSEDVITFDPETFPPSNPAAIRVTRVLPSLTQGNLTIDASDAGIIIDGSAIEEPDVWGLEVVSDGNSIYGLQIINFTGFGIQIVWRSQFNTIGGDRSIGNGPLGRGNLCSGNSGGILLCDEATSHNTLSGNLIGTDLTTSQAFGNTDGVFVFGGASHNTIGPDNVIAYNREHAVVIQGGSSVENTITQNSIHSNGWGGIKLFEGGNRDLLPPLITSYVLSLGHVAGTARANCTVELFSEELAWANHDRSHSLSAEGRQYEGGVVVSSNGTFLLDKNAPFVYPHLTATVTDAEGNTSEFSLATSGGTQSWGLQSDYDHPMYRIEPPIGIGLRFNRIGTMLPLLDSEEMWRADWVMERMDLVGFMWNKFYIDVPDWNEVGIYEGYSDGRITSAQDSLVDQFVERGWKTVLGLVFWDESANDRVKYSGAVYSRYETEEEVHTYLDHVRSIVRHFKGRIEYYEILNEPNAAIGTQQHVEVDDYINLVRGVIPVIRQEDPQAKIVIGAVASASGMGDEGIEYLFSILESDVMSLVDVISWHPFNGESPAYPNTADYYYGYPSLIQQMGAAATAHGFAGELLGSELLWQTELTEHICPGCGGPSYSPVQAAKYYARGITSQLGMDILTGVGGVDVVVPIFAVVRNLSTVMAGHESIDMPVEVDIEYDEPVAYCAFRYPNGDRILAVWTDGVAHDEDPGAPATITFPGLTVGNVTGIDVLHGFEQELTFEIDGADTIVRDLLVKDYPILIRLSDVTMGPDYEETVGDGFHQLGEPSAGTGLDRDGDGVPDDEDFCPDWPGSAATSGC